MTIRLRSGQEWSQYIGIPWEAGAQGPDAYDCWAFFRMVQARHFGIDVPAVVVQDYDDPRILVNLFRRHGENDRWVPVEKPVHGDGVIVRNPLHAGVWLDVDGGGVLHCARGCGVIFTRDSAWSMSGFGRREFRRFSA